jgi:hypothetical protein
MEQEEVKIEAYLIRHTQDEVNILQYIDGHKLSRLYLSNNFSGLCHIKRYLVYFFYILLTVHLDVILVSTV